MNTEKLPALAATREPGDRDLLTAIKHTSEGKEWECPCCRRALPFQSLEWLDELSMLVSRYGGRCISPDIAGLTLMESWGVYQWLSRLGG